MITQVRPSQLAAWLTANHNGTHSAVVLDVREPWELQMASVQATGFALVCIPMRSVPERLSELNKDQAIAVLCHHGMRSQQVAHFLMQSGFGTVANITGGIELWSTEVDPAVPHY